MKEFIISEAQTEKAVLVGLITPEQNEQKVKEYLDELAFLADTAGVEAVKRFYQKLDYPNSVTFVGSGKLQEIKEYVVENEIGLVIFDDELSAKQLRNIEKELQVKILDRTNLILDIFARRAQTAHAKTQVELAQYKYMLPRLTRLWTHLERQRGGVGMRGPGETQLETDKRIILDKISKLKRDLVEIDKQKSVQRKNRGKMVRVALVGYTNVGKSTLMKSFGIAVYLAHMGFPVAATSMQFRIQDGMYTSINVPDNINLGYSHFYAEVLRVKKVAIEVSRDKRLIVIFDELFKGTNVKDAFDATLAVTEAIAERKNCAFMVSTHIIEVGQELGKRCNNVTFEYLPTVMKGKLPTYTYKLEQGITSDKHGMIIINNEKIIEIIKGEVAS